MAKLVTFIWKNRNGIVTFEPEGKDKFMVRATDGVAKVTEEQAAFMKTHHLFNKVFWLHRPQQSIPAAAQAVIADDKPTSIVVDAELSNKLRETADAATGGIDIVARIREQAAADKKTNMGALVEQERLAEPPPVKEKNANRVAAGKRAAALMAERRAKNQEVVQKGATS